MSDTEIFKCFSCFREWEDYEDKYALQMRKCSICLNPICLKCHADKTKKQHCFSCENPKGKNKEEVKRERKERYEMNKCNNKMLKDLELDIEAKSNTKKEDFKASVICVAPLNIMRINSSMMSNDVNLSFS